MSLTYDKGELHALIYIRKSFAKRRFISRYLSFIMIFMFYFINYYQYYLYIKLLEIFIQDCSKLEIVFSYHNYNE